MTDSGGAVHGHSRPTDHPTQAQDGTQFRHRAVPNSGTERRPIQAQDAGCDNAASGERHAMSPDVHHGLEKTGKATARVFRLKDVLVEEQAMLSIFLVPTWSDRVNVQICLALGETVSRNAPPPRSAEKLQTHLVTISRRAS